MKRSKYCGKEYPDGTVICVVDEQPLESVQPLDFGLSGCFECPVVT